MKSSVKNTSRSKQRSLHESAPETLAYLLQRINHSWELLSFNLEDHAWAADLLVKDRKLRLTFENELVRLQQVLSNNRHKAELLQEQDTKSGLNQVARLINKVVATG